MALTLGSVATGSISVASMAKDSRRTGFLNRSPMVYEVRDDKDRRIRTQRSKKTPGQNPAFLTSISVSNKLSLTRLRRAFDVLL
jgi:hypothetical protein